MMMMMMMAFSFYFPAGFFSIVSFDGFVVSKVLSSSNGVLATSKNILQQIEKGLIKSFFSFLQSFLFL